MNEQLKNFKQNALDWFTALSQREQLIVAGGTAGLVVALLYAFIFSPIVDFIEQQEQDVAAAYRELQALPHALARYDRVRTRRAEIEKLYKSIEMPEGASAYLETLVKDKAGIPPAGFTIKESIPRKFGNIYEQVPYNVQYRITDHNKLINFLQELIEGPRPFIVNRVNLSRSRLGDHIEVDLEVSSVRKTQ